VQEMEIHREDSLAQYRGRHIKVAIVDSGIDSRHPKLSKLSGGIELAVNKKGRIISGLGTAFTDRVGHGTACAGIVHRIAPAADIYSVRIFGETLAVDGRLLIAALHWAIEQRMDVVNISLGTTELAFKEELERVCREAAEQRVIVVAAAHNEGVPSYPVLLPEVIGVVGGQVRGYGAYYYRARAEIECIARGDMQRVCWVERREITRQDSSFSAPHMTGAIALLREKVPQASLAQIRELLQTHALNEPRAQVVEQKVVSKKKAPSAAIKKGVLYPYNQEMRALVRFKDLLSFEIVGVVDPAGGEWLGRDAGEAIGAPPVGVSIGANWQRVCDGADTLLLGRITHRDLLRGCIERALARDLHVFSFSPLPQARYANLYAIAESKGRRLFSAWIDGRQALAQSRKEVLAAVDVPVVGILGTSGAQGGFALQLGLRRQLLQRGYRLGQLGTEPQSRLFGMDFCFPIDAGLCLPLQYYPEFLAQQMRWLSSRRPDLVLVGCQSGIIPPNREPACSHSLPALAFLLGTRPDACILVVSASDSAAYIQDTLAALRAIGKTEVLALAVSEEEEKPPTEPGGNWHRASQTSLSEGVGKLEYLQRRFLLPAVPMIGGEQRLLALVEEYFSAEEAGRCLRRSA
jgi:uncharacterized NAD-dependent epimerase/dehydratase family protein